MLGGHNIFTHLKNILDTLEKPHNSSMGVWYWKSHNNMREIRHLAKMSISSNALRMSLQCVIL